MLLNKIKELATAYKDEFVQIRHHIHAYPELSYEEFETSKFIQQKLTEYGISFTVIATTGVLGIIKGKNPESRIIALRADMDALPIQEENNVDYKSTKAGIMHACGHDVHTTCLLGAAKILSETKEDWEGTVKLLFQPGEEKNPGGATFMIKAGALENPSPARIFAMHVHPGLEVGKISFRSGIVMASADELYITIKGKGGHAASPHLSIDTILIASQLVVSLQQIVSRNNNPFNPTVLSITSFNGGYTTNVIPSEVKLMGTFRAMNEEWRYKAHELIKKHTHELVTMLGAEVDLHIDIGYPCVLNNEELHTKAWRLAEQLMGEENIETTEPRMGAEDFAYYSHKIPACFYRVGAGNKAKGITSGVHTPTFNIDEQAIENGIAMFSWLGAMG